jgi:hypothetical protein
MLVSTLIEDREDATGRGDLAAASRLAELIASAHQLEIRVRFVPDAERLRDVETGEIR